MQETMMSNLTQTQPTEGKLTATVDKVTGNIPSMAFLGMAIGSMAFSVGLFLAKDRKDLANFVGLWVPSFLLLGIYNKIVKTEGSDRRENLH